MEEDVLDVHIHKWEHRQVLELFFQVQAHPKRGTPDVEALLEILREHTQMRGEYVAEMKLIFRQ